MGREELNVVSYYKEYAATSMSVDSIKTSKHSYEIYRRIIDIMIGVLGLVIGLPIMIIFGVLIRLETPGPIFYVQERVGKGGKCFKLYKLRSMVVDAEENGAQWAEKNDNRVTKVGRFIRKTRIDEIPQFYNILKGDMSIIGPRPERPLFTLEFSEDMPNFLERLKVKPGLTGWAQVNGGYEITPKEKLALDMYYIDNMSVKLDFIIILKTIKVIFTGSGAR